MLSRRQPSQGGSDRGRSRECGLAWCQPSVGVPHWGAARARRPLRSVPRWRLSHRYELPIRESRWGHLRPRDLGSGHDLAGWPPGRTRPSPQGRITAVQHDTEPNCGRVDAGSNCPCRHPLGVANAWTGAWARRCVHCSVRSGSRPGGAAKRGERRVQRDNPWARSGAAIRAVAPSVASPPPWCITESLGTGQTGQDVRVDPGPQVDTKRLLRTRRLLAAVVIGIALVGCSDDDPPAAPTTEAVANCVASGRGRSPFQTFREMPCSMPSRRSRKRDWSWSRRGCLMETRRARTPSCGTRNRLRVKWCPLGHASGSGPRTVSPHRHRPRISAERDGGISGRSDTPRVPVTEFTDVGLPFRLEVAVA